jgi:AraC-like DNA-binding protein
MSQEPATRPMSFATCMGAISRLAFAAARNAGVDLSPRLGRAGLTSPQIEDREVRLDAQAQIRFLQLAAEALGDDLLGFHLARDSDLREMRDLYYVFASSETLGDGLRRVARYASLTNEVFSLKCLSRNELTVRIDYVGIPRHSDRQQIEFFVTLLIRICRLLTGRNLTPSRISFAHRRAGDLSQLERFFGCKVDFGTEHDEVAFPESARDLHLVSTDPYLNEILVRHLEEALARRKTGSSALRASVENAIGPLLPHAAARVDTVARQLGMSPRTLARRLASEGLTFAGILDELRQDLARRHLGDADLSISEIAWLLG